MSVLLLIAPWLTAVAPVLMVGRYTACKQRWWRHPAGRTIVGIDLGVLVISAGVLIRRWHGISAGTGQWISVLAWLFIGLVIIAQWLALEIRNSRQQRFRTAAAEQADRQSATSRASNGQHVDAAEEDDAAP
jgi:hypothetical protein